MSIYETEPVEISNDYIDYAYAACKCPVPSHMALKIPKDHDALYCKRCRYNGKYGYSFKCRKCGCSGIIFSS